MKEKEGEKRQLGTVVESFSDLHTKESPPFFQLHFTSF